MYFLSSFSVIAWQAPFAGIQVYAQDSIILKFTYSNRAQAPTQQKPCSTSIKKKTPRIKNARSAHKKCNLLFTTSQFTLFTHCFCSNARFATFEALSSDTTVFSVQGAQYKNIPVTPSKS